MSRSERSQLDLIQRPRRLRATPLLRAMVEETRLSPKDFICPMFIEEGGRGRGLNNPDYKTDFALMKAISAQFGVGRILERFHGAQSA